MAHGTGAKTSAAATVLPLAHAALPAHTPNRGPFGGRDIPVGILTCLVIFALIVLAAVFAPLVAPHDPLEQSLLLRNKPPAWMPGAAPTYLLGTDNLGYDLFSRILYGARVSLGIGFLAAVINAVIGTALGLVAGFVRGPVDGLIMLLADAELATPFIVIAIAAIAAFGKGIPVLIVLAGVSSWMLFARTIRSSVLSLREREFVMAARAVGATETRVALRHLLPNLGSILLVLVTVSLRNLILFEASLSFLGLGVQPPQASWGSMIDRGREYLGTAWWISVWPGAALMLTILVVSLIGDWLSDALNPSH